MPLCVERAIKTDTFFLTKPTYYHEADTITQSGGNITGFRKPSVTDAYTKAQIENAECYFVYGSNRAGTSAVTFTDATKTINLISPQIYAGTGNPLADHFALANLLPSMKVGEWGFRRSGSDVVIYVRTAGAVEYSARKNAIDLSGVSNIEMADFVVRQIACPGKSDAPVLIDNPGAKHSNIHLHDFEVNDCLAIDGYAPIYGAGVNALHIHDFSVTRAQGMFGMFFQGRGAANADWPGLRVDRNISLPAGVTVTGQTSGETGVVRFTNGDDIYFEREASGKPFVTGETLLVGGSGIGAVSNLGDIGNLGRADLVDQDLGLHVHDFEMNFVSSAAIRLFTQRDAAIHHGIIREAGKQSHGNTWNPYQGCHNILFWGVNGQDSDGYATHQESDSLVIAFCALSGSTTPNGGNRAYSAQQNRYSEHPGNAHGWLGSYYLNNRGTPVPSRVTSTTLGNGLNLSSAYAPLDLWTVWNNIHHGSSNEDGAALADWDFNINTKPSGTGSGTRGSNDVVVGAEALYTDPVNGDFGYRADSAVRTFAAKDWSGLIPGFRTRWPQVPAEAFARDMAGAAIEWSSPPVGPTVDPDADYRARPASGGSVVPPPPPPPDGPARPVVRARVLRLSVMAA